MTYPSIQVLRGIAALSVVYFHAVLQLRIPMGRSESILPEFGAWGVDLFFVISGFVMWTSTAGRNVRPGEFYRRRIVRIAPLYWGITACACLVALAAPHLLRSTTLDGAHILASFLFLPWPNPGLPAGHEDVLSPLVIPGWTLNYEMFFYLLFGLSLLVSEQRRPLLIAALLGGSMALATLFAPVVPVMGFYANRMLLEFLAGVLIAVFAGQLNWRGPDRLAWLAIAALLVCLCLAEAGGGLGARAFYLGPVAALVIAVAAATDRNGIMRNGALLKLGDASYSIYLVHIFVITGLRVVLSLSGFQVRDLMGEMIFVVGAMTASIAAGYALHRMFELPATLLASRMLLAPRRPAPLAA